VTHADWPEFPITPTHIAGRLKIGGQWPDKTLRAWLRQNPPIPHARYERWEFTPAQAEEIMRRWKSRS
jgi:hypothetical protein